MSAPGTANVNAIQNDLPDSGTAPVAVKENVNAMANDYLEETVLFQFNDGTLALLPASQAKALADPEPLPKAKLCCSSTSKALSEAKGKLVPSDHPKYAVWKDAVQGKAPDGGNCNQYRGTFYRSDNNGNRIPLEV